MICQTKMIVDISSLFRNGVLIARSSVTFTIQNCQNLNLDIFVRPICCCNKRYRNVSFRITNNGAQTFSNGNLRVILSPYYNANSCANIKTYNIGDLGSGYSKIINLRIPFNPCFKYCLCAQIIFNNLILKEECRII